MQVSKKTNPLGVLWTAASRPISSPCFFHRLMVTPELRQTWGCNPLPRGERPWNLDPRKQKRSFRPSDADQLLSEDHSSTRKRTLVSCILVDPLTDHVLYKYLDTFFVLEKSGEARLPRINAYYVDFQCAFLLALPRQARLSCG